MNQTLDLTTVQIGDIIDETNIITQTTRQLKVTDKKEENGTIILETVPV